MPLRPEPHAQQKRARGQIPSLESQARCSQSHSSLWPAISPAQSTHAARYFGRAVAGEAAWAQFFYTLSVPVLQAEPRPLGAKQVAE